MRRIFPSPAEDITPGHLLEREHRPPHPDRPWVMLNMVASVDGRIQGSDGRSGPLSGPPDRALFHALRAHADVVLAGAGTVRAENYGPVRLPDEVVRRRLGAGRPARPRLAVVTGSLGLAPESRLFEARSPGDRTLVLASPSAVAGHPDAVRALEEVATIVPVGDATLDWPAALAELRRHGPLLLVEGGPGVNAQLLAADLVDEICLTLSPVTAGGRGLTLAEGPPVPDGRLVLDRVAEAENFLLLRYLRRKPGKTSETVS